MRYHHGMFSRVMTVLSFLGSLASIIALFGKNAEHLPTSIWLVPLILSLWIMFSPKRPKIVRNVSEKLEAVRLRWFRHPEGDSYLKQSGTILLPGSGEYSISFEIPFVDNPKFSFQRRDGWPVLKVTECCPSHVEFTASSGNYPTSVGWTAMGVPFEEEIHRSS